MPTPTSMHSLNIDMGDLLLRLIAALIIMSFFYRLMKVMITSYLDQDKEQTRDAMDYLREQTKVHTAKLSLTSTTKHFQESKKALKSKLSPLEDYCESYTDKLIRMLQENTSKEGELHETTVENIINKLEQNIVETWLKNLFESKSGPLMGLLFKTYQFDLETIQGGLSLWNLSLKGKNVNLGDYLDLLISNQKKKDYFIPIAKDSYEKLIFTMISHINNYKILRNESLEHLQVFKSMSNIQLEKFKNAYLTLGLPFGADEKQVKKSFHRLAQLYHPDKKETEKNDSATFLRLQSAYEVVLEAIKKTKSGQKFLEKRLSEMNYL